MELDLTKLEAAARAAKEAERPGAWPFGRRAFDNLVTPDVVLELVRRARLAGDADPDDDLDDVLPLASFTLNVTPEQRKPLPINLPSLALDMADSEGGSHD